jgi:lipoprotein-anchoring transpeptidase ErfK/SrfK
MRVAAPIIVSCILASSGAGVVFSHFGDSSRASRDLLETGKRLVRDVAAQRQKTDQIAQANAQPELGLEQGTTPRSAPTPPAQHESVSTGAPVPVPSASAGSGDVDSNQPAAPSAVGATVVTPSSAEPESGMPLANQPGAPPGQEGVPGAPLPTAPESSTPSNSPAPNQPVTPLASTEPPPAPPPRVVITVDKATQRMRVTVDGKLRYSWPVSTGRPHYETPSGTFRPLRLARVHYSKEWDHAPMPHSIFFSEQGHAIHATNATRQLGRRASHGCVRLAPSTAAALFALVRAEGPSVTKVTITSGTTARKAARSRTVHARARR